MVNKRFKLSDMSFERSIYTMRKITALILLSALLLINTSCSFTFTVTPSAPEYIINAKILEINGNIILIEPLPGEDALRSSDRIMFVSGDIANNNAAVGDIITVTYDGTIKESYPAQIDAIKWEISQKS